MFPRVTKVGKGENAREYLQILESYRKDGTSRHRVVASLGRVDQLADKMDKLVSALQKYCRNPMVALEEFGLSAACEWGQVLLARHLWDEVGLGELVERLCQGRRKFDVAETAFVLLANRLCEPTSEHGLARWLEHTFVCDRDGCRWQPEWLPTERVTKLQRVKVASKQLKPWYRTLDALFAAKEQIEVELYRRVRDLFHVKVDLVFYDLTTAFFQRREPRGELRRHGLSKDGKPRNVQIVLGVVMANGWPIAHHVFAGNTTDKATLQDVLTDLDARFGIGRVMFVADRGLVSKKNLELLDGLPFRYLMAIKGRRSDEATRALDAVEPDKWIDISPDNRVQEIEPDGEVRYFVVESTERMAYEKALRERSMERTREALDKIVAAVQAGRLKGEAKIAARAAEAMAKNHAKRYYSTEVSAARFQYFEDPAKMQAELLREGRYILKTDDQHISAREAVATYKQLSDVEWAFRDLKDVIAMRPIYHKTDPRVKAHIFVATLALFLKRTLEHHLQEKGIVLSPTDAFAAMRSIGVAELDLDGKRKRLVSPPGSDAKQIVEALAISRLAPPEPKSPHTKAVNMAL